MTIITTVGGRRRRLPAHLNAADVYGLDAMGRFVINPMAEFHERPEYLFGLTLCCNAYDKGTEDGVCCRACYGTKHNADIGNYLFPDADGRFPGLDPVAEHIDLAREEVTTDD